MILKGSQRGGAKQLGAHLLKTEENEHVELHDIRGFLSDDVIGALREAEAIAKGTIPRDTLSERVLTACAPFHLILRNTSSPGAGDKPRAGAPPG